MAYQVLSHQVFSTASRHAVDLVVAELAAGSIAKGKAFETYEKHLEAIYDKMNEKATADNEKLAESADDDSSSSRRSGGRSKGRGRRGGAGKKKFTADEAGEVEIKFGAFTGCTIDEVYGFSKSDSEEYDYDKPGKKWLEWAQENANSDFFRDAVTAYLEGQE